MDNQTPMKLKVSESLAKDMGKAYARMDPKDLKQLDAAIGDLIQVKGERPTVCKAMPAFKESRGQNRIQLDGITRENAGAKIDTTIFLEKITAQPARTVHLSPLSPLPKGSDLTYIASLLDGLPVMVGDKVRAILFGSRWTDFKVKDTQPEGAVMITPQTRLQVEKSQSTKSPKSSDLSYEDIGGLKSQLQRIREMIELPLAHPELFDQLGIDAPRGVLLHGPPGCGKTLIARAIAHETEAAFYPINGPEIIHKFYGESEAHLRKIFEQASQHGPSIIFLDEIDAIAPKREKVVGDVEKRVVAQLLALMDGLSQRKNLIVIAATNLPNVLDPALRRPGRFDREIAIPIPDRFGRHEILEVHSRGMPLEKDVSLKYLSKITHGFVGADLKALCREAAMACLRRVIPDVGFSKTGISNEQFSSLIVRIDDFTTGMHEVSPSAIREFFVEVPDVRWSDVGGLKTVKERLKEAVEWPLTHFQYFEKMNCIPPRGILLTGPPGCGKTLLAKAAATESQVNFISVKGPALLSKFVGASEESVRDTFKKARQAAPCIVFFDEIDALVPKRGIASSDSQVTERVLSQLLTELDGIEELKGVCVLGATNRKDMLDDAILRPGRFDEIIEITPPEEEARREIFNVHLKDKPCTEDVHTIQWSEKTKGFTGADIAAVCNMAAMAAIRKAIGDQKKSPDSILINSKEMETAIKTIKTNGQ